MAAATGGYTPTEPLAEPIPVELFLTPPAKILCSAIFVSGRDESEVWRDRHSSASCFTPSCSPHPEPENHRVDPIIWVNSKALIMNSIKTAGSTCNFWVNPVNFTFRAVRK